LKSSIRPSIPDYENILKVMIATLSYMVIIIQQKLSTNGSIKSRPFKFRPDTGSADCGVKLSMASLACSTTEELT
jgi:hypothetical protein